MSRALGTDDSITTCDCCGKSNLKFTVAIELDSGEVVHYGQVCAARNTGKTKSTINNEIKAHEADTLRLARAEWERHPAYLAERARFAERDRAGVKPGRASVEFVHEAREAAKRARAEVAHRYGLESYQLS